MKGKIGIVREAYSIWERRAPFTPKQVNQIVKRYGVDVLVQPSTKRVFSDRQYVAAGAKLTDDLSACNAIFGVKQVPIEDLIPDKTYLFFSHVIKAQMENMPLMDELMAKNIRLIDYECITKDGQKGAPRLVAFGEYAGKAGLIDSIRGLGAQLLHKGISTPFLNVGSSYMYPSYKDASEAVERAGLAFTREHANQPATPFNPLVFLFTGSGNVNRGARDVFNKMPHRWVQPEELEKLIQSGDTSTPIIGCQVSVQHMVERLGGGEFSKQEYYEKPSLYQSIFFERYARHSNCLVNGIYWDPRFPRVVSKSDLANGAQTGSRMHFISDISCDIGGGIESFHRSTSVEDPFLFVEEPAEASDVMIMGVDILPSELPREASSHFGDYLLPFVEQLAQKNETKDLAPELQGATIVDNGKLEDKFSYIQLMRNEKLRELNGVEIGEQTQLQLEGSTVIRCEGHLFDSGLINKMLDIVEDQQGRFHIVECLVGPNSTSSVLLQITMDQGRPQLDDVLSQMEALASSDSYADAVAKIEEMPKNHCMGDFSATLNQDTSNRTKGNNSSEIASNDVAWHPLSTITILGAGMVAGPCVEYLSRDSSCNVVVCSVLESEAQELARKVGRSNVQPMALNAAEEPEKLAALIARSNTVISILPQTMHVPVAKLCIENKVPLVTASYVSPEMRQLDQAAKDSGIPILCEMGLDPGMDHMSAMMVIDEIRDAGGKLSSFRSVCGGLPAPEAANNPFGYKFSWSPVGVLMAMNNNAQFLQDGRKVQVSGGADLLDAATPFRMHQLPSLALEELPNRDSLIYSDTYGIPDAATCFRGTLRYEGFCNIFAELLRAGFTKSDKSFDDAMKTLAGQVDPGHASRSAMDWLLSEGKAANADFSQPALTTFAGALEERLAMQPGERDLCVMQHTFNEGERVSTLLSYGDDKDTGMARTVGLTAGVGAKLVLEGRKSGSHMHGAAGVMVPIEKRVYQPGLAMLAEEGIIFNHH